MLVSVESTELHVGVALVRDSGRKKQVLSRLSESDSWIWDEGNMTRSAAFAPLESMLTTRLLAAD